MFKVKDTYVSLENILQINYKQLADFDYIQIVYMFSNTVINIELDNGINEYYHWADQISEEVNRRLYERS